MVVTRIKFGARQRKSSSNLAHPLTAEECVNSIKGVMVHVIVINHMIKRTEEVHNTMASPVAASTAATANLAALISPEAYNALVEENKKLKVKVGRIKDSHKITAMVAMNQGRGKMTIKRIEEEFGRERATDVSAVLSVARKSIWPKQKILNNKWIRFSSGSDTRSICSLLMRKMRTYEGDVKEVLWKILVVPAVRTQLNNQRSTYMREAKKVFLGKFLIIDACIVHCTFPHMCFVFLCMVLFQQKGQKEVSMSTLSIRQVVTKRELKLLKV